MEETPARSPLTIELVEDPVTAALADYARVPIAFSVDRVLEVTRRSDDANDVLLSERRLEVPYEKHYDTLDGEAPPRWVRFDLSNWAIFVARLAGRAVGGAAIVFDTPDVTMLEGRRDLAVLWDIRVSPDTRGRGVGSTLFETAEAWARQRGCRQLKVETQNTNVQACRFYERQGCRLRTIKHGAYPTLPEEIQLLWYKDLRD
jgi:GNAT superfamily N-acetyltransferase